MDVLDGTTEKECGTGHSLHATYVSASVSSQLLASTATELHPPA